MEFISQAVVSEYVIQSEHDFRRGRHVSLRVLPQLLRNLSRVVLGRDGAFAAQPRQAP